MKTFVKYAPAICCLLFIMNCCSSTADYLRPRYASEHRWGTSSGEDDSLQTDADTVILVSALCCEEEYDWRRDTAYGAARYQLLLLERDSVLLRIPAGDGYLASPDPDLHHILGGHLYTETCVGQQTVLCCDGVEKLRVEGRYLLKGLLEREGELFSAWVPRDGDGFALYRGNDLLLESGHGILFGGFDKPSYLPSGAVYLDKGQVCLAFSESEEDYLVRDGSARPLSSMGFSGHAMDIKQVDGKVVAYKGDAWGRSWSNLEIWPGPVLTGEYSFPSLSLNVAGAYNVAEQSLVRLSFGGSNIYYSRQSGVHGIKRTGEGLVMRLDGGGESFLYSGKYWYLPVSCACTIGKEFVIGLTPLDGNSHPRVEAGRDSFEIPWLDGLITGVSYTVR